MVEMTAKEIQRTNKILEHVETCSKFGVQFLCNDNVCRFWTRGFSVSVKKQNAKSPFIAGGQKNNAWMLLDADGSTISLEFSLETLVAKAISVLFGAYTGVLIADFCKAIPNDT